MNACFQNREELFDFYKDREEFLQLIPIFENLEKSLVDQGFDEEAVEMYLLKKADEEFSNIYYLDIGVGD